MSQFQSLTNKTVEFEPMKSTLVFFLESLKRIHAEYFKVILYERKIHIYTACKKVIRIKLIYYFDMGQYSENFVHLRFFSSFLIKNGL